MRQSLSMAFVVTGDVDGSVACCSSACRPNLVASRLQDIARGTGWHMSCSVRDNSGISQSFFFASLRDASVSDDQRVLFFVLSSVKLARPDGPEC